MTTDATGGYQPPGSERPLGSVSGSGTTSEASTTDTAKEQAGQVGLKAKEQAGQVASTAKDEAKNVAGEAKNQARNLLGETQSQVREQASSQKEKASGGLRSLADELRSMAEGTQASGPTSGMATDLARQASDKAHELASWLDSREPGDLLEEVRDLARRKPGAFLLGAAAAGMVAGRLTRGAVDAKRAESDSPSTYDTSSFSTTGYSSPVPTPAASTGYAPPVGGGTRTGDDVVLVEDAVVVETDPFGARPQRTTVGGDPL